MLEIPGQVLELSMSVGRGTKPPPPATCGFRHGRLTTNLNLRALFDIISSSGRSPEELFLRSGNSGLRLSVQLSVNIPCYRISSKTTVRNF